MTAKTSKSTDRSVDAALPDDCETAMAADRSNFRNVSDHGLSLEGPPPAPEGAAADHQTLPPIAPRKKVQAPPVARQERTKEVPTSGVPRWFQRILKLRPRDRNTSWMTSLVVHAVLLLGMALVVWQEDNPESRYLSLVSSPGDPEAIGADELMTLNREQDAGNLTEVVLLPEIESTDFHSIPSEPYTPAQENDPKPRDHFSSVEPTDDWKLSSGFASGGGLDGREAVARARLGKRHGATEKSETAVEMGLAWIAAHQRPSGGWRFQHHEGACAGRCRNPGSVASTTGATGLALLAYLGAGYTHEKGKYHQVVNRGLYYLTSRMLVSDHGGDLQEGTMYAQGIATVALCEAYAMTRDEALRGFAQKGIDFILYAQNRQTGGWRYLPGQPGDTIVLGWQLMALRSGSMVGLDIPRAAVYRAGRFLDRVQSGGGAFYGYQSIQRRPTTTAVGLLSRMLTGWKKDRPELVRGVEYLAKLGPSQNDLYFNYYASQVLHHTGSPSWKSWNQRMQKRLVRSQSRDGHERGSWYFTGGHSQSAGRLYYTAMAVMTLEVYYRYLPLYTDDAIEARR